MSFGSSATAKGTNVLASKFSMLSGATLGNKSLYSYRGYNALAVQNNDDTVFVGPNNGNYTPALGSKITFSLQKTSQIIGKCWLEIPLSAGSTFGSLPNYGVFNPAAAWTTPGPLAGNWPQAEYVKNVGDLIVNNHVIVYGTTNLQYIPGIFHAIKRRVACNDVNIEGTNAMVLGALPPSGRTTALPPNTADPASQASTEAVLINAFYQGVTLYVPCEEYFWTKNRDEFHMTEAYALDLQIQMQLANLADIVCTRTRNSSVLNVLPAVTNVILRYEEITVSAAEKQNKLALYATPEGQVQHFLDLELVTQQFIRGTGVRAPGSALSAQPVLSQQIDLSGLRMDIGCMYFTIHRWSNSSAATDFPLENGVLSTGYAGSPLESNAEIPSLLFEGSGTQTSGFATLVPCINFRHLAGTVSLDAAPFGDFWDRAMIRKKYFPDAQVGDFIYIKSPALFPVDSKNATGHISPSTTGNMKLELNVNNPGSTIVYLVSVFSNCHNLMQSRTGGLGKALL